jgi:hypothetical protein
MRFNFCFLLAVVVLGAWCPDVNAQKKASEKPTLPDFSGVWVLDAEKSFSKNERKKLSDYTLTITQSDVVIKLVWDYTIDGRRSYYSETLYADGRNDEADRTRGGDSFEPWSYKTTWKNKTLTRKFGYRTSRQSSGSYIDYRTYALAEGGRTLTIKTIFRPAQLSQGYSPSTQKLVFNKQ